MPKQLGPRSRCATGWGGLVSRVSTGTGTDGLVKVTFEDYRPNKATAYVCENYTYKEPVTKKANLAKQLDRRK